MALFDSLVPQLQERTSRGDEVQRLLEALLEEITDPKRGGLVGFLANFSNAGFSRLVHSWLEHDPYAIASAAQVRYALGDALMHRLANEAGMTPGSASMVLALMIPGVIHRLTPGGRVPSVRELSDLVEGRSTPAVTAPGQDANVATPPGVNTRGWLDRMRSPTFLYGAPIVWLLLIALAGWCSMCAGATPPAAAAVGPHGSSPPPLVSNPRCDFPRGRGV